MKKYLFKRFIMLIFVLIGISIVSFGLSKVSTLDAAEVYVRLNSQTPTEEQIEEQREKMGLNNPIHIQYFDWLKNVLKLDFGTSLRTRTPVSEAFFSNLLPTVTLVVMTLIISSIITLILAMVSSYYKGGFLDHIIRIFNIAGMSVPNFWIGYMLLLVFAVKLNWVPIVSEFSLKEGILPSFTLSIPYIAMNVRLLRSCLLDNIDKDHVVYARARGIPERIIMIRYILKNSLAPMITVLGQSIGYLLAGTAIIESVFSWPGLGSFILKSIMTRDFPVINMYVLFMAVIFVLSNMVADIINIKMNPVLLDSMGEL